MEKIGVIDIGSNTIRLVVYEVQSAIAGTVQSDVFSPPPVSASAERDGSDDVDASKSASMESPIGSSPSDSSIEFEVILNEAVVAGLSSYVEGGVMSDDGIRAACQALHSLDKRAHAIGCEDLHPFATAAIRNCSNSRQVVGSIEAATGLHIDVIAGEEEARLGFVGAQIGADIENGVLIDLGGGSTELTVIDGGQGIFETSIGMGCVSAYKQFVSMIIPTDSESDAIGCDFESRLAGTGIARFAPQKRLYGLGGGAYSTVRMKSEIENTLAAVERGGQTIYPDELRNILALYRTEPSEFAHTAVKAVPNMLHMIVPACIIIESLMRAFDAERLTFCEYGIREGYLLERILK